MSDDSEIPEHWSLHSEKNSKGASKFIATARDGRRIEATGDDYDRLLLDVKTSIRDLDAQIERQIERRRLESR